MRTSLTGVAGTRHDKDLRVTLLPDPEPHERHYRVISVDDHLIEPPDIFEGRVPARFRDVVPRVQERPDGAEVWVLDGREIATVGLAAAVGRPSASWNEEPARFDEIRRGCWDVDARVADMEIAGIERSLCFPSALPGFAGRRFARLRDQDLGLALVRAWNDWYLDEWYGKHPDRFILLQLAWLGSPEVAAEEVYANAARGFRAVTFSENPASHGLPSLHTGYWDPFLRACAETGTVVCLHVGSSSWSPVAAPDAPMVEYSTLFPVSAIAAVADWVWSGVLARYPALRIALSEGGIGWVPMIFERLDYALEHALQGVTPWEEDISASELARRSMWFCTVDEPSGFKLREEIGIEKIMVESDYPHSDSSWPDTQEVLRRNLSDLTPTEIELVTHKNAEELFSLVPSTAGSA